MNTYYVSGSEAQARSKVDNKQSVVPRQPNSMSLLDPEAPTRTFGSYGQREVTVVQRPSGIPQALVSSSDKQWSWRSIDQLDQAICELVNEGSVNFQQSANVTGSRSVPYQLIPASAGNEYDSQIELIRGRSSTSSSSQTSLSAVNLEVESVNERSQPAVS